MITTEVRRSKRPVIHLVAGARPNFMKIAPLWHSLRRCGDEFEVAIVHTGQHYDDEMSDVFLRQFGLPAPSYSLGIGSASHAKQTAAVMIAYEDVCVLARPDWVVVVGDVNSTVAAAIVAKKLLLPVAHLEAGLRSFDRTMPEEINRILTDSIADLLWTPSPDADLNLAHEGVRADRIERVGNIMIDAFEMLRSQIATADWPGKHGIETGSYGVVTIHRPANVDHPERLAALVAALEQIAGRVSLVLPLHPRTRERLGSSGLLARLNSLPQLKLCRPLGYIEFMSAVSSARFVLTDSGGVQEETTYLGIPCLTLRDTTERPITVKEGSNRLTRIETLDADIDEVLAGPLRIDRRVEMWDGQTADRVVQSLRRHIAAGTKQSH